MQLAVCPLGPLRRPKGQATSAQDAGAFATGIACCLLRIGT